jgi:hypothetical protein
MRLSFLRRLKFFRKCGERGINPPGEAAVPERE